MRLTGFQEAQKSIRQKVFKPRAAAHRPGEKPHSLLLQTATTISQPDRGLKRLGTTRLLLPASANSNTRSAYRRRSTSSYLHHITTLFTFTSSSSIHPPHAHRPPRSAPNTLRPQLASQVR